jgi:hypothetical protein
MQEEARKDKESDKRSLMISVPAFLVHKGNDVYGNCQVSESAEFEIAISRVSVTSPDAYLGRGSEPLKAADMHSEPVVR